MARVLGPERTTGSPLRYFFLDRYRESFVHEWEAFISYVIDGGPSPVPGEDARASVVIGLAAWQSVREGRAVRVDRG
jgi:myo-inositol 2-dehydrogenase/D-chiro-inositol 1-dehydrogenase